MRRLGGAAVALGAVLAAAALAGACGDGGLGPHGPVPHPACTPGAAPVSMTGDLFIFDGHKDGVTFRPAHVWCRPGVFVNASPPHGIQEE